jgi:hypothetical protein
MRTTTLLLPLIAALALIAGCTKSSPDSTVAPTEPAAAVQTAPTTAADPGPAEATEAPQPTEAPEAPTETPGPKVIEVIGDEAFQDWARQALELIETRAPDAYEEVHASIDVIESVPAGSGMYVKEKRFAVGDQTAHAPGFSQDQQLIWFAGTIVHDAHHSARYAQGLDPSGKEAEIDCLTVQKAALELITDDPYFGNYLQGIIDGADDPENQYWTQPDRHW